MNNTNDSIKRHKFVLFLSLLVWSRKWSIRPIGEERGRGEDRSWCYGTSSNLTNMLTRRLNSLLIVSQSIPLRFVQTNACLIHLNVRPGQPAFFLLVNDEFHLREWTTDENERQVRNSLTYEEILSVTCQTTRDGNWAESKKIISVAFELAHRWWEGGTRAWRAVWSSSKRKWSRKCFFKFVSRSLTN